MNALTLREWIGLAITVIGALITFVVTWTKLGGRMDRVEADNAKSFAHHKDHYESVRGIETLVAAIDQRIAAHIEEDRTHFANIAEMLKENRQDLKDILHKLEVTYLRQPDHEEDTAFTRREWRHEKSNLDTIAALQKERFDRIEGKLERR